MENCHQNNDDHQRQVLENTLQNKPSTINNQSQSNSNFDIELKLRNSLDRINTSNQIQQFAPLIKEYCRMIVGRHQEELFINHFVQIKFLEVLQHKLQEFNYESCLLGTIFSVFQILLQAIKKQQNLIYFLLTINQLGYISEIYNFSDEEDIPYYANFLKLLICKINEEEMYLSVFFNSKEPHFPLILNLLKLSNCADQIMQTSAKFAIIKISSNFNTAIKKYIVNFPFIIFYPIIVEQIGTILDTILEEDEEEKAYKLMTQSLSNHLMYMKQFIDNKEEISVDMYANTFLQIIGKRIYAEMNNFDDKYTQRIKKLIKLLLKNIIPQISVAKINTGLSLLFSPITTASIQKCFESELIEMNNQYWLMDQCLQDVIDHCTTIFFNQNHDNESIIKTMGNYIPWSKDNWLYYELKKISKFVGKQVNLNEPLNHYHSYLPDSFLMALETLPDQLRITNHLFQNIINQKDEELLYLYLRLVDSLLLGRNDYLSFFNLGHIIKQLAICNSLALIQSFYVLLLHVPLRIQQLELSYLYSQLTQKLINYVMTKGWSQFLIKIKQSKLKQNDENFIQDVYREIECDVLLFVAIRTLLGSFNDKGSKFNKEEWRIKSDMTSQIAFKCQTYNKQDSLLFILDGQYLCIKNQKHVNIHHDDLLLRNIQFYDDQNGIVQLVGRQSDSWGITLYFSNQIKSYLLQEINSRKRLATRIELQLKCMQFQFAY